MYRFCGAVIISAILGTFGWFAFAAESTKEKQQSAALLAPLHQAAELGNFTGSRSCAATACHGSVTPDTRIGNIRRDEFIVWTEKDKHFGAWHTLFNDESLGIFERLGVMSEGNITDEKGYEKIFQSCAACHSPGSQELTQFPVSKSSDTELVPQTLKVSDISQKKSRDMLDRGVSCEACHGGAEKWRIHHFRQDWFELDAETKAGKYGMVDTKNLLAQARLCAKCHVGSPGRDVNHDLIAAGHPAMKFEFSAYLDHMHKHWDDRPERKSDPNFELRVWSAGQIASTEAALGQLNDRARAAASNAEGAVWPEFAEYECFACHHDLDSPSWRQKRGYGQRRPGNLPWGTWYFATPRLAASLGESSSFVEQYDAQWSKLRDLMQSSFSPDPAEVQRLSADLFQQLQSFIDADGGFVHSSNIHHSKVNNLLAQQAAAQDTSSEPGNSLVADWDTAAQVYLAMVASNISYGDHLRNQGKDLTDGDKKIIESLKALRKDLAFPSGHDSPRNFSGLLQNSARKPSQREKVRQQLLEVLQKLRSR